MSSKPELHDSDTEATITLPPDEVTPIEIHAEPGKSDHAQSVTSQNDEQKAPEPEPAREELMHQYVRFSRVRKACIVAILSFCSFLAPISSTAILSAVPEVAETYKTTGDIINASNALYVAFMGFSSPFWGPLSQVYGRRPVSIMLYCIYVFMYVYPDELTVSYRRYCRYFFIAHFCFVPLALVLRWPQI